MSNIAITITNTTSEDIQLTDLEGITLPASESYELTDLFDILEISNSITLSQKVSAGDVSINGLGIDDSLKCLHIKTGYESSIYNSTTSTPPPTATCIIWYDTMDNQVYIFDRNRGKWLSVERRLFTFSYKNADNVKMKIDNLNHGDIGYLIPKKATIVSVYGSATHGEDSKGFSIEVNNNDVFEFEMVDYKYKNANINIDIDEDSKLSMMVGKDGKKIRNPIVCVEVVWRYN